jgi:hypothetical protein
MKKLLFILFVVITTNIFSQGVAINTDASNPDASAILDVKATDKGVLIPRMTQSQKNAIASPATGLLVYQSDGTSGFYYYDGSAWVRTATSTNATYTGGTGIGVSGNVITNTSPDQTVNLTGGGATSVSGTYPNFTISSTDNNSGGSVTSVGLSLPSIFSVSNSPVTTTGTLTGTLTNQSANTVLAGPTTGSSDAPTFRALVSADIPSGSGNYIQNGTSAQTSANYNIDGNGTLGGDINVNGSDINGPGISGGSSGILRINSNTDVRVALDKDANGSQQFDITPNGTSTPIFTVTEAGNVTANGYVRMLEAGTTPTYYTTLQSGDLTGANLTLTLPTSGGTSGQYLKTDGTGVTSWSTLTQSGTTVNQTATITPTTTTMATITGLTTTFTADANHVYFVSTHGCIFDNSATTNRNVNSQIGVYVDGVVLNGATQAVTAQNYGTTSLWGYGPWSITTMVTLSAGSHTIDVRGNRRTESNVDNPTIGGAAAGVCQGSLTVMVLTK